MLENKKIRLDTWMKEIQMCKVKGIQMHADKLIQMCYYSEIQMLNNPGAYIKKRGPGMSGWFQTDVYR